MTLNLRRTAPRFLPATIVCLCACLSFWGHVAAAEVAPVGDKLLVAPSLSWSIGDSWTVRVRQYSMDWMFHRDVKETSLIADYRVKIEVKAEEVFAERWCWVMEYSPLGVPVWSPAQSYKYRLWIDKQDGMIRKLNETSGGGKLIPNIETFGRVRILDLSPSWFPLHFLPMNAADIELVRKDFPQLRLAVRRDDIRNNSLLEFSRGRSAFERDSPPAHRIVQKWKSGSKWWDSYEEYRHGYSFLKAEIATDSGQSGSQVLPRPESPK